VFVQYFSFDINWHSLLTLCHFHCPSVPFSHWVFNTFEVLLTHLILYLFIALFVFSLDPSRYISPVAYTQPSARIDGWWTLTDDQLNSVGDAWWYTVVRVRWNVNADGHDVFGDVDWSILSTTFVCLHRVWWCGIQAWARSGTATAPTFLHDSLPARTCTRIFLLHSINYSSSLFLMVFNCFHFSLRFVHVVGV